MWELVKMEIRASAINFSKQRAKSKEKGNLSKKAEKLKRKLTKKETKEFLAEQNKIISELDNIPF